MEIQFSGKSEDTNVRVKKVRVKKKEAVLWSRPTCEKRMNNATHSMDNLKGCSTSSLGGAGLFSTGLLRQGAGVILFYYYYYFFSMEDLVVSYTSERDSPLLS